MTLVAEILKSLCCSNGWCYGAFWRFDPQNPMLVTMEDSYFEAKMGEVLRETLGDAHMVGEGIVGNAAFTGKHQWLFAETYCKEQGFASFEGVSSQEHASGIHKLFSSGIRTIAVISVELLGVLQFGSTQKIMEKPEFLDQTIRMFSDGDNRNEINSLAVTRPSLIYANDELTGWFDSLCAGSITSFHDIAYNEPIEMLDDSSNLSQSSALITDVPQETMSHLFLDSSYSNDPEVFFFGDPDLQLRKTASTPAALSTINTCIGTSEQNSLSEPLESWLQSEIGAHGWSNVIQKAVTPLSCGSSGITCFEDSTITSLCDMEGLNVKRTTLEEHYKPSTINQHSTSSIPLVEGEHREAEASLNQMGDEFRFDHFTQHLSNTYAEDNFFSCFAPTTEQNISGMETIINDNPCRLRASLVPSGLSNHSSLDTLSRENGVQGQNSMDDKLFEVLGMEGVRGKAMDCWEQMMTKTSDIKGMGDSECSMLDVCTIVPQKGLFTELGLQEILDSISNLKPLTTYSIEGQSSVTKRRREESLSCDTNQDHKATGCRSCTSKTREPPFSLDMMSSLFPKGESLSKSQVHSVVDNDYCRNAGRSVLAKAGKFDEPKQATRKRARPGESTRPRPKDRQLIQDRIKELRGIIPDGSKISIDQLLDRAAKHIFFLQGVTELAEKLKQIDVPKLTDKEKTTLPSSNKAENAGATWAVEVGHETMVCPLVVEDLHTPGMMLVKMLCEDHGLFLEIADIIKGSGLNVIKGAMERREDKIWAHFIAEAQKPVTRMELFMNLVKHLKLASSNATETRNQLGSLTNDGIPLLNGCDMHCYVS